MHHKHALEVKSPEGFIPNTTALLSNTLGRVNALPAAVLIGQEKVFDWIKGPDEKKIKKEIRNLKKDDRLKNTLVRLGYADPFDDLSRLYKLDQNNFLDKVLGTLSLPTAFIGPTLNRMDHYNPLTDVATIYAGIPEIAHHELGHARDFNKERAFLRRTARTLAPTLENTLLSMIPGYSSQLPGLTTQYLESRANEEAEAGYKKDKQEFRRRLWPARGTYWAALAAGLTMLNPTIRSKVKEFVSNPEDSKTKRKLKLMAIGLAPLAVGALGGRAVAEIKNRL